MQFILFLLLALCITPTPATADVTVGTMMLLNEGRATDLTCDAEEHTVIQNAVTELIPEVSPSSDRRQLANCDLCYIYFPYNLAYCIYLYPDGRCQHLARRDRRALRANTFKDDVTTHPKYQAQCKKQSKALERMVTKKSFLQEFSPECGELLSQKMKFVCVVTED